MKTKNKMILELLEAIDVYEKIIEELTRDKQEVTRYFERCRETLANLYTKLTGENAVPDQCIGEWHDWLIQELNKWNCENKTGKCKNYVIG